MTPTGRRVRNAAKPNFIFEESSCCIFIVVIYLYEIMIGLQWQWISEQCREEEFVLIDFCQLRCFGRSMIDECKRFLKTAEKK